MAKKQEDSRDIFDKVADYIAPVAGAVIGARLGPRLIGGVSKSNMKRVLGNAERMEESARKIRGKKRPTWGDADEAFGLDKAAISNREAYGSMYRSRTRGAVAGGVAGGAAGHVGGQEAKKRRK